MDFVKSSTRLFGANALKALVLFAGTALFAKTLGASQIGTFFLFQGTTVILSLVADLGIRGSVEKRLSEGFNPSDVLTTSIALKLAPLLGVTFCIFAFDQFSTSLFGSPLSLHLIVSVVSFESFMFSVKVLNGELRVGESAVLQALRYLVWLFVSSTLLVLNLTTFPLITGLIAGQIIAFLEGIRRINTTFGSLSYSCAYSLITFSKYDFIAYLRGQIYNWTDILVIGVFLSQASVGQYEIAWRVTAVVMILSTSLANSMFPQISKWNSKQKLNKIQQLIPSVITPSVIFVIPSFFGVLIFSEQILGIIFGEEFVTTSSVLVLQILMADKVIEAFQVVFDRSLRALNRPDLAAYAALAAIFSNIIFNIILVILFGIIGAAVATFISSIIGIALYGGFLSQIIELRFRKFEIVWCIISSLGMYIILIIYTNLFSVNSMLTLGLAVGMGGISYFLFVLFSPSLRRRISDLLQKLTSSGV